MVVAFPALAGFRGVPRVVRQLPKVVLHQVVGYWFRRVAGYWSWRAERQLQTLGIDLPDESQEARDRVAPMGVHSDRAGMSK
jgi:hypothetical protein